MSARWRVGEVGMRPIDDRRVVSFMNARDAK